jgi:hypothetical protein
VRRPCVCSLLLLLALLAGACGRAESPDTPAGAVRHFLEVMDRSSDDDAALSEAYGLLDQTTRSALAARAARTRSLSGQQYEPWQMLAQGRFRLRFAPARGGMHERVTGERAVVVVNGGNANERAEVPLVREQGRWRIQLALPPMRSDAPGRQSDG